MELSTILSTSDSKRDEAWEKSFLEALKTCRLQVLIPEPQLGPDGFTYLLASPAEGANSAFNEVAQWLARRGIGLVINPQKEPYPDYVFNYGTLWNFVERGEFFSDQRHEKPASETYAIQDGQTLHVGEPSEGYIPKYVRGMLKQFFLDQAVLRPEWAMISQDGGKNFDLVFSLESIGNPPEKEHRGILEALSWFLPSHYSVGLLSQKVSSQFFVL